MDYNVTIRRKEVHQMLEVYSEKLGQLVSISVDDTEGESRIVMEESNDSLVGWTHGGWNNDNGGAGW